VARTHDRSTLAGLPAPTPAATGERRQRLLTLLDDINQRWGRGTLRFLAEGLVQPWRMRRERMTPGYTTNWRELPVVG
jgi:DNA polymerase V